jgi:hypothetical protein
MLVSLLTTCVVELIACTEKVTLCLEVDGYTAALSS